MRALVVGSGGREHALAWKIAQSDLVSEVLCVPGNAGIDEVARCIAPAGPGIEGIVEVARREHVGLVVVGPEAELAAGLVDRLEAAGIPAFGPSAAAARLESSKAFAKAVMAEASVPTAAFSFHEDVGSALDAARARDGRCVVKADGLAAGKGVAVCRTVEQAEAAIRRALQERAFGDAGSAVLVEDLLEGEELSVLALCDGSRGVCMVAARDHKRALDGDRGPNTGGMGAFAPAPLGDEALLARCRQAIIVPIVEAMARRGTPFAGVLYAGLMLSDGEARVLELNVRFGDPETQPLMLLLDDDLVPLLMACASGELDQASLRWRPGAALTVVMASGGYPGAHATGLPISGLGEVRERLDVVVFHSGTRREAGRVVTAGGRVLGVTARGADLSEARERAYEAVSSISFEGERHRSDIGLGPAGKEGMR